MTKPLVVSIPHRLGKEEALRRIKAGWARAHTDYARLLTVNDEVWNGDRLTFRVSALAQTASGTLDVTEDHVQLEVTLPWLLAALASKLTPAIRKEGTLMLGKK